MPYTNPWSDTIPPGSAPANTIDDIIRQLRLDIHERMNNVTADWTADPVVPNPAFGGAASKLMIVNPTQWIVSDQTSAGLGQTLKYTESGLTISSLASPGFPGSIILLAPLVIPQLAAGASNITITNISLLCNISAGRNILFKLGRVNYPLNVITQTDMVTKSLVSPGVSIGNLFAVSSGTVSVPLTNSGTTDTYYLYLSYNTLISANTDQKVYAASITYTCPNNAVTV